MIYLTNATSITMLPVFDFDEYESQKIKIMPIRPELVSSLLSANVFKHYIGHTDTVNVLSSILGVKLGEKNREALRVNDEWDTIIVCQYDHNGQRLPEGATQLPDGAKFKFFALEILAQI